jgi:hypothetical protein
MKYEEPTLIVLRFEYNDVIRTSDGNGDGIDDITGLPIAPGGTTGENVGGWGE